MVRESKKLRFLLRFANQGRFENQNSFNLKIDSRLTNQKFFMLIKPETPEKYFNELTPLVRSHQYVDSISFARQVQIPIG